MIAQSLRTLFCLLAACLLCTSVQAEPVKNPTTGIVYPDLIAGFDRLSYTDFEKDHPGLGYSYSYATPHAPTAPERITATVYAYTAGVKQIPEQAEHPAMDRLRAQTLDEIKNYAQGRNATLTPLQSQTLKIATTKGKISVLCDGFNSTHETGPTNTWVFLWPARGHFMKIRITGRGQVDQLPEQSRRFVEQMVKISFK